MMYFLLPRDLGNAEAMLLRCYRLRFLKIPSRSASMVDCILLPELSSRHTMYIVLWYTLSSHKEEYRMQGLLFAVSSSLDEDSRIEHAHSSVLLVHGRIAVHEFNGSILAKNEA